MTPFGLSIKRASIGVLLLLAAPAMYFLLRYLPTLPSPTVIQDQVREATIFFSIDRTVSFAGGECITVQWDVEKIQEVYYDGIPAVGQEQRELCLPNALFAFSTQVLKVKFADDTWREYAITIYGLAPALLYTVVPLLFAASYALRLHRRIPDFRRFIEPHPRLHFFTEPFVEQGRINPALVYLFVGVNLIVASNAILHNPGIAYDESAHRLYVATLAQGRLPDVTDTYEFFSPPLPYVLPAIASRVIPIINPMKIGQLQNILVSLGITFYLLKICGALHPNNIRFKLISLALLGMLPVYYKTLVFVRGEQFVTLFALFVIYELLRTMPDTYQPSLRDALKIGFGMGLMLLSRQWAGFVVLAIVLWVILIVIKRGRRALPLVKMSIAATIVASIIAGWFYLSLSVRYGSLLSFNRNPKRDFAVPAEFFTGLGDGKLFTSPYGLAFPRQFIPTFYTETWGDYEGYFFLPHDVPITRDVLAYMGRVNAFALIPSTVLLLGLIAASRHFIRFLRRDDLETAGYSLSFLVILISMVGYLWFVMAYPNVTGDTIKATYLLHIFPLLAILAGAFLADIRNRSLSLYRTVLFLLFVSFIHNLPALFTRHIRL